MIKKHRVFLFKANIINLMCGFVGFLSNNYNSHNAENTLKKMAEKIEHRGPDDTGYFFLPQKGIALGHKRLSIVDLSKQGRQPMISASGRFVIIFNGEIYNYIELKKKYLEGKYNFKSNTDTEVILSLIEIYGLYKALNLCYGMFAFALYDKEENNLILARDRIGEKPIYYGWCESDFVFASEIKALKLHHNWKNKISDLALKNFFKYNYVPSPLSIYQDIFKLEANKYLKISNKKNEWIIEKNESWDKHLFKSQNNNFHNYSDLLDYGNSQLRKIIKQQSRADVPVGCFLSGGIDSSLVASVMQENNINKINTFTIGYSEDLYDESNDAESIANHLGTNHHKIMTTATDAINIIPNLSEIYDEPFADASQIPTSIISKFTKNHVKVCLSGDGGDELFGGYNRYIWAGSIHKKYKYIPLQIRNILSFFLLSCSPSFYNKYFSYFEKIFRKEIQIDNIGEKIVKIANLLNISEDKDIYHKLVSFWDDGPTNLNKEKLIIQEKINEYWNTNKSFEENMMHIDKITYLTDDILVKVDRASMHYSLETRAPFLDKRMLELSNLTPQEYKINNKEGKIILRDLLNRYIPTEKIKKSKKGFAVPISSWLRGPLKDWAENLLSQSNLKNDEFFNYELILKKWQQHLSGNYNYQYELWSILMFQSWFNSN